MSQNFTNVLTTLSNPNIQAVASFDIATTAGTLSTFFGVPLVLTYATLGAPFASLNAIATSAETIEQALLAGNYLGAVGALIDAPAHALDGFLNSATVLDTPILVPTGLPSPLPRRSGSRCTCLSTGFSCRRIPSPRRSASRVLRFLFPVSQPP